MKTSVPDATPTTAASLEVVGPMKASAAGVLATPEIKSASASYVGVE